MILKLLSEISRRAGIKHSSLSAVRVIQVASSWDVLPSPRTLGPLVNSFASMNVAVHRSVVSITFPSKVSEVLEGALPSDACLNVAVRLASCVFKKLVFEK